MNDVLLSALGVSAILVMVGVAVVSSLAHLGWKARHEAHDARFERLEARVEALELGDVTFDLIMDSNMATTADAVVMVNDQGIIEKANHACYTITGHEKTLIGQHVNVLVPAGARPAHTANMDRYWARDPQVRQMGAGQDLTLLHASGRELPVKIGLTPITKGDRLLVVAYIKPD